MEIKGRKMKSSKQIVGHTTFFKRVNELLIALSALALTLGTFVLLAAIGVLLSGCATTPKYEIVRADRWIVKDGYVVGEKQQPIERQAVATAKDNPNTETAVKEGRLADSGVVNDDKANETSDNPSANGKYCDNEAKLHSGEDRNIKHNRNSYFNGDRRFNDRDRDINSDRNATLEKNNRVATLAFYKNKPIDAIEEAWVRSVMPNTQIELIRRSPAVGFYTAFLGGGQIVYVNPSQRLLFFGEIYTHVGDNLTNISRERFVEIKTSQAALEINATELETLGFGEISGDKFVAMVYSPLCPYCHKADEFLSNNQIPVKRIFLLNLQSPNDEGVKRAVEYLTTASKETREALLAKWRSSEGYEAPIAVDGQIDRQTQEAVALLTRMSKFVERNGIDGTPYIYLVNRKSRKVDQLITGFNASTTGEQIRAWFANNENQTNGDKQ
jgi:glutaredoxin